MTSPLYQSVLLLSFLFSCLFFREYSFSTTVISVSTTTAWGGRGFGILRLHMQGEPKKKETKSKKYQLSHAVGRAANREVDSTEPLNALVTTG